MYALIVTVFIDTIGFGIVLPLLPLYAQDIGASPELVTLVAASFTCGQALFGPFWGWLSDRIGRKKVLIITVFGTACAYILLAFTTKLWVLFLVRFFGGAMAANMGVANALVADITSPQDRTKNLAKLSSAAGLGFVAGPAIGGLLAGFEFRGSVFLLPYLVAALFSFVALFLVLKIVKDVSPIENKIERESTTILNSWKNVLTNSQTRLLLFLMLAPPFVFAGIEVIIVLWSERLWGWGPIENGYFYAWMGASHVLIQWFLIGPLAKLLGERMLVTLGALSLCVGAVCMPLASAEFQLYIAAALMILGTASSSAALSSLLSIHADSQNRGSVLGLGQAFAGMGRIGGPALSGVVFVLLGVDWPFYFGALVMVFMCFASRLILVRRATELCD